MLGGGGGCLVTRSCQTLLRPLDCGRQAALPMEFPEQNTGWDCHFLLITLGVYFISNSPNIFLEKHLIRSDGANKGK